MTLFSNAESPLIERSIRMLANYELYVLGESSDYGRTGGITILHFFSCTSWFKSLTALIT